MLQVESTGEALITIGGPGGWGPELLTEAELALILKRVEKVMGDAFADMTILRQRKVPSNSEAAGELLAWHCLEFAVCHATLKFVINLASTGSVAFLPIICVGDADTNADTVLKLRMTHEVLCRECYGRCSGKGKSQSWCSVSSRAEGSHHWQCGLWQVHHGKSQLSCAMLSWFRQSTSLNSAIYLLHLMQACAFALLARFAEKLCGTAVFFDCPGLLLDPQCHSAGGSAD